MRIVQWAALVLLAAPALAAAQRPSCPAADSALGPVQKGYLDVRYDEMTDSTHIVSAPEGDLNMGSSAGAAIITFASEVAGRLSETQEIGPAISTAEVVVVSADDRDGIFAAATKIDPAMQKYMNVKAVRVLLDDSVRIALPVTSHQARIRPGDDVYPAFLLETLQLSVAQRDLVAIGRAKKAKIRIGDLTKTIHGHVLKSIGAQARAVLCATSPRS